MKHLFEAVEAKQKPLEELADRLMSMASLLGLHAWYQSRGGVDEPNLSAAAEDAEAAARILRGEAA